MPRRSRDLPSEHAEETGSAKDGTYTASGRVKNSDLPSLAGLRVVVLAVRIGKSHVLAKSDLTGDGAYETTFDLPTARRADPLDLFVEARQTSILEARELLTSAEQRRPRA